jgi:hypothetical protein
MEPCNTQLKVQLISVENPLPLLITLPSYMYFLYSIYICSSQTDIIILYNIYNNVHIYPLLDPLYKFQNVFLSVLHNDEIYPFKIH